MSSHATKIKRSSDGELIDAELHDDLGLDAFFEAEESWAPERVRVLRECVKAQVGEDDIPQSVHWNWALKTLKLRTVPLGPLSPYRLFGVRSEGAWQGLLLACCMGHGSRLQSQRDLVYVDFVEVAPWNWEVRATRRTPSFRGCGLQLIELAVRWSEDVGYKGRIGLHSLRQSEEFYRARCHLTDLGPDPKYKPPMRYMELSESDANAWFLKED